MYPIVSDRSYVVYVEYLLLTARNHLREFTVGMVVSLALVTAFLFFFFVGVSAACPLQYVA